MSPHTPMTATPIGLSPLSVVFWQRLGNCSIGSVLLIADLPRNCNIFKKQFLLANL